MIEDTIALIGGGLCFWGMILLAAWMFWALNNVSKNTHAIVELLRRRGR